MNPFGTQPPANTGASTSERDPAADLFNAEYVFGARVYPIDESPGPSTGFPTAAAIAAPTAAPSSTREAPIDLTIPAHRQPTPAAMGGPNVGGDDRWFFWPSGQNTLVVSVPSGDDVRSIYLPTVLFPISIGVGQAPGATMYQITQIGHEMVPIPQGAPTVALTALTTAAWSGVWVFASSRFFGPGKGGPGTQASAPSAALAYDALIAGTNGLSHYWPLNDPAGTVLCVDYGPVPIPMQSLGSCALGVSNFIAGDGATCAYSNGFSGTGLTPTSAIATGFGTLEFWVFPTSSGGTLVAMQGDSTIGYAVCALGIAVDGNLTVRFQGVTTETGFALPLNASYYFAMTFGTSTADVYCNGSLVWVYSGSISTAFDQPTFLMQYDGGTPSPVTHLTTGKVARIATYTNVLSLLQIQQHYAAG